MGVAEACRYLAQEHGYENKKDYCYTYIDPLGIDFQIHYGTGSRMPVIAWLGGIEVLKNGYATRNHFENGNWVDLLRVLDSYHIDLVAGEEPISFHLNLSLIEACKSTAMANRRLIQQYSEYCMDIAKEKGEEKWHSDGTMEYVYAEDTRAGQIRVCYELDYKRRDTVCVHCDKETKFIYHFNERKSPNGIFDRKCKFVPGTWETPFRLMTSH